MNSTAGKKIFLAGLFHETHSFVDDTTPLSSFEILRGNEIYQCLGDASPMGGFLEFAKECGWEISPGADYRAIPSGTVEDEVVEAFWQDIREHWTSVADAIFLVLHGAMASVSTPDVEGEILKRIRQLPGAGSIPIFGVYDLHGNFSPAMAEFCDCLLAYRENPHIDAREAAIRSAKLLERSLSNNQVPKVSLRNTELIWTPERTGTATDPMQTLERLARNLEAQASSVWAANIAAGFAYSDTPDTGVSFQIIGTGDYENVLDEWESVSEKLDLTAPGIELLSPTKAMEQLDKVDGLTVLTEPSDNIGGGAPGDGTGLLRSLVEHGVEQGAICINDPAAVEILQDVEIGDTVTFALGGKGSHLDAGPLTLEIELVSRSSGSFELEDKQSHLASVAGSYFTMGPTAVVRHKGVTILLTSNKTPPFDLGQWRSQGIEPTDFKVIVAKAAVAHLRVYEPIASNVIWVDTPGPCTPAIDSLPYRFRQGSR